MKKLRIAFFGTPEFSAIILKGLLKLHPNFYHLAAVVTQPDRPSGRRQIPTPSPVKILAQKHQIPVLTPKALDKNFLKFHFSLLTSHLAILAAYGKVIPKGLLKIPQLGFLNIHPSLLPQYRGPSPIEYAILKGEKETGVTIILMDEKIDHGPIVSQAKIKIDKTDTKTSLTRKLAQLATELLLITLPPYLAYYHQKQPYLLRDARPWKGKAILSLPPKPQDQKKATFTRILTREDGKIDWSKPLQEIERMIRAFDPWPGSWTGVLIQGRKAKAKPILDRKRLKRLRILSAHLEHGVLILDRVQLEGKRPVSFEEFKRGYPDFEFV